MEEDFDTNSAQQSTKWIALSITSEYPQGDVIGKLLAYASLSPYALICSFITLILFRRDLHTMVYFLGILISEAINHVLKNIFRQPRPMTRKADDEYGMPSSHSQFLWFFAIYMLLFVWIRLKHLSNPNTIWMWIWKAAVSAGCVFASIVVSVSRVYLMYHTVSQVVIGSLLGSILAVLWFLFVHFALTPFFPTIASWRFCEWLLIRDQTLIPNIIWFEYTSHRHEIRARSRKLVSMKSQ